MNLILDGFLSFRSLLIHQAIVTRNPNGDKPKNDCHKVTQAQREAFGQYSYWHKACFCLMNILLFWRGNVSYLNWLCINDLNRITLRLSHSGLFHSHTLLSSTIFSQVLVWPLAGDRFTLLNYPETRTSLRISNWRPYLNSIKLFRFIAITCCDMCFPITDWWFHKIEIILKNLPIDKAGRLQIQCRFAVNALLMPLLGGITRLSLLATTCILFWRFPAFLA